MIKLMNTNKRNSSGYTLVELITVLVILAVTAAMVIPSFAGFIEKVKEEQYILKAQGMRRTVELYLIDKNDPDIDTMMLLWELTSTRLDSPKHPLANYMTVRCTKGAAIEGLTINTATYQVFGIRYRVAGYLIEIDGSSVKINLIPKQKNKESSSKFSTVSALYWVQAFRPSYFLPLQVILSQEVITCATDSVKKQIQNPAQNRIPTVMVTEMCRRSIRSLTKM